MTAAAWSKVKQSKMFYVMIYRRAGTMMLVSAVMNVLFLFGIILCYKNQRLPDYYATSGIIAPIELKARTAPNRSSEALLPPDPITENEQRYIPE